MGVSFLKSGGGDFYIFQFGADRFWQQGRGIVSMPSIVFLARPARVPFGKN